MAYVSKNTMSENVAFSPKATDEERKDAADLLKDYRDRSVSVNVIIDRYTENSGIYEKNMEISNYTGHIQTAKALGGLYPSNRDQVVVLDVAAGTGLCGTEMRKLGFKKMDAFDASEGMLEVARNNGLYQNYILGCLGNDKMNIETDAYDVITMTAFSTAILQKLPLKAFQELVRVVKPGGYVINTTYEETYSECVLLSAQLVKHTKTLVIEGKFKLLNKIPFHGYINGRDGAVQIFQVC